ncbi:MAG TPA: protein kinase [Pyrinomonadaceae bacterium]|nr:protein kinase [Pyrinomonadaceae bacterium]
MPLSPGTKLGRYEILSQLGVGGMGEVYLAQDSKLDRKVALKVLPADLAIKQERMSRFVREAKAAAALNHPSIAHIYEIGEEEDLHFIAMEFVDGKTLREKIHYEKSDLKKLLKYLQQVASGLAKAHAAGIVHRDLKPDNIMISKDGYAKILDFGLAKLVEAPASVFGSETASDVATVARDEHSIPGRLLGTVGYMSPEQAQGKTEIDHRSDIFSFGCMLFEAITQRRPFQGESKVQSLYRIVYEPAPPLSEFNPLAPGELQRIVRRCLAKDPDERYQSIQDVAIELKELRRDLEGNTQIDTTVSPSMMNSELAGGQKFYRQMEPTVGAPTVTDVNLAGRPTTSAEFIISEIKQHKRGLGITLVLLVVAVAGLIALWWKFGAQGVAAEPFRTMRITRLTTGGKIGNAEIRGYATISPDGKYVVFRTTEADKDSLWVRQVLTGSLVKIVPDSAAKIGGTTFSKDGEYIYYSVFDVNDPLGTLYQVPVLGGPPRRVMAGVTSPVTFSPDGKQLAFVRPSAVESDLLVANADGTGERKIATRKLPGYFAFIGGPAWSPDGKTIACGAGSFSGNLAGTVVSVPAEGGTEEPLTSHTWVSVSRLLWQSDGKGLIVAAVPDLISAGTQIWFVAYPGGDVRRITNDLNAYGTTSLGLTADSRTLVTIQADKSAQIWVAGLGAGAETKQITSGKYDGDTFAWSPDGKIFYTAPSGEQSDIWTINPDGSGNKQLTTDVYTESLGSVSPDSRFVVFSSNRSGNFNLWRMDLQSGAQIQLTEGAEVDSQPSITPDGQWVVFRSFRQGTATVWKVPLAGGAPEQVTNKASTWAAISPDGKLVAVRYFDDQAKANKIAVIPLAGGAESRTLDVPLNYRDEGLAFTADSSAVMYAAAKDNADNIWSLPLAGGLPKQLTNFTSGLIFAFQVSADGKQIVISRGTQTDDVILLRDGS